MYEYVMKCCHSSYLDYQLIFVREEGFLPKIGYETWMNVSSAETGRGSTE